MRTARRQETCSIHRATLPTASATGLQARKGLHAQTDTRDGRERRVCKSGDERFRENRPFVAACNGFARDSRATRLPNTSCCPAKPSYPAIGVAKASQAAILPGKIDVRSLPILQTRRCLPFAARKTRIESNATARMPTGAAIKHGIVPLMRRSRVGASARPLPYS